MGSLIMNVTGTVHAESIESGAFAVAMSLIFRATYSEAGDEARETHGLVDFGGR